MLKMSQHFLEMNPRYFVKYLIPREKYFVDTWKYFILLMYNHFLIMHHSPNECIYSFRTFEAD